MNSPKALSGNCRIALGLPVDWRSTKDNIHMNLGLAIKKWLHARFQLLMSRFFYARFVTILPHDGHKEWRGKAGEDDLWLQPARYGVTLAQEE